MTKIDTYSLRITDTNQDLLIDYLKSIQASYVIGVIEIGSETEKEHYHSIFYTDLKINNIRNQLTRRGIVKSRQYSLKLTDTPIEGISYSIKQGLYSTNMDISHIPKWIPKEEFIKQRSTFTYTKMIAGYTPLVGENLKHKQILTHVYYYVIDNWYGKLLTDESVQKYVDSIVHHWYYIQKHKPDIWESRHQKNLSEIYKKYL